MSPKPLNFRIRDYENGETYFVHTGRLGTAGIVTDYSGAVIQDELHYPWSQEWTMAGTMMEERFAPAFDAMAARRRDRGISKGVFKD